MEKQDILKNTKLKTSVAYERSDFVVSDSEEGASEGNQILKNEDS